MPKLIALAMADLHLGKFKNFNDHPTGTREDWLFKALDHIAMKAIDYKVPLLNAGDLFHNPKETENETMSKAQGALDNLCSRGLSMISISGNHDMSQKNSIDYSSPSHLDSFTHFKSLQKGDFKWSKEPGANVYGIPYLNNPGEINGILGSLNIPKERNALNILMLHQDIPGAFTPTGIQIGEGEAIDTSLFEKFDLVLCGHIHRAQKIGKNCYMLGCPIHQDASNIGHKCGYWKVYSDGSMKFVSLNKKFPIFIQLNSGETPYNDKDYFINPDEVLVEEDEAEGEFNLSKSRTKLATKYLKVRGVKSKAKKRALIEILNQPE